jgi:hypothetical protein
VGTLDGPGISSIFNSWIETRIGCFDEIKVEQIHGSENLHAGRTSLLRQKILLTADWAHEQDKKAAATAEPAFGCASCLAEA